jgi:hypothetical protein
VTHKTAKSFWECYKKLPIEIQNLANRNFELLKSDIYHPSLHFKKVGRVWSARVGITYRAVSAEIKDGYLWIWIGSHQDYDKLIAKI